ncbi:MAG: hypothetical protein IPK15_09575 [Verrucomicrobia bacterium]|nr:hypothetical protein [Verrucomicrobiota bacterium]
MRSTRTACGALHFQTLTALAGVNTLLDLRTAGWGVNAQFGVMLRPRKDLQFGLTYKARRGEQQGDASGQYRRQLAGINLGARATGLPLRHRSRERVSADGQ